MIHEPAIIPPPPDEQLAELVFSRAELIGAVVASLDGRVIAADLPSSHDPRQISAMLASTFGLGQRLTGLLGSSPIDEISVASGDGLVTVYAVGDRAALLLLSRPGVNLGLLQRTARQTAATLVTAIDLASEPPGGDGP